MALHEDGVNVEKLRRSLEHRWPWTPSASRGPLELVRSRRRAPRQDFQDVLEQVRLKAPKRFSHAREVLRILGSGSSGSREDCYLQRSQARAFFRAFDVSTDHADRFFEHLASASGEEDSDQVSYRSFLKQVGPFLELPGIEAAMQSVGWGSHVRPWLHNELWYNRDAEPPTPLEVQHCREQADHLGLRKAPMTPRKPVGENGRSPQRPSSSSRRPLNATDRSQLLSASSGAAVPETSWAAARAAQEKASASLLQPREEAHCAVGAAAMASSFSPPLDASATAAETAPAAPAPAAPAAVPVEAAPPKSFADLVAEGPATSPTEAVTAAVEKKPTTDQGPAALMSGGRPLARPFGQPRGSRAPHRGRTLVAPAQGST